MKGMSGGLHLGKGVQDNGYGQFLFMLGYKLEECGKHLIKVDRYFASSKICSVCGHKKKELALSDRMYVCECGNRMDRDVNAAVNIREEGKRIYKGMPDGTRKIRNRINAKNKTAGHARG